MPDTSRARARVLAGLAVLTLLAAIGVALAPVVVDDPVVSWPQAGQQPRSTVLPLVPYRPLSLDAAIPCAALIALDQRPEGGDALRTLPASAGTTGTISQGLLVTVHRGVVQISASGQLLVREALPEPECAYRVLADSGGARALRDGMLLGAASVEVPQVSELSTDVDGERSAAGLAASLHLDARYESIPTALKTGLLVGCVAALLVLLGLAWRWWRGEQVAPIRCPRPRVADAVLVGVSAAWVLLAPMNFDDSWYAQMARGAADSGAIGNAIYMFNVSETPFVTSQYVLLAWGCLGQFLGVGWGLAWLRLVPLCYGLLTWVLLRVFLVTSFGRELDRPRIAYALLVAYLLWWLPYGMTLRPEPLIVLLAAATLLLAELARARRSIGVLAAATTTAALALTVSPSGLVAVAPLVLSLPWLWTWLRDQLAIARLAAVLVLVAAALSCLVLVGCADATLGDVLEATAVHQWYYQSFPWYQEHVHYQTILSFKDSAQWARRAPVLLTLAVLALVALGRLRRPGADPDGADPLWRLLVSSALCSALALALLAPTPTKFVNHFGAAAAAPTVLLAAALLRSPLPWPTRSSSALSWPQWRSVRFRVAVAGTALMVGAVSWSFAGPNIWRPHSDRGQPFGDHLTLAEDRIDLASVRPKLGPVPLANPLIWIAVALAAAWGVHWWRRRGRETGLTETRLTPDRAVLFTGSGALVVITVVVFVWAPLRQTPGWSVAQSMLASIKNQPCALAGYAEVLLDTPTQPAPTGPTARYGGFAALESLPLPMAPPAPGTLIWQDAATREVGSDLDGNPDAGSLIKPGGLLVTPWFTLPAQATAAQNAALVVPVLGARTGQRLTLEYATAPGPDPDVVGSVTLTVDRVTPETEWQQATIAVEELGPAPPVSVRLVVHARVSSADTRLAVGAPRLASWRPLMTVTTGAPVYVDQLTATLLPCLDQVGVEHGIAQAPQLLVLSDEGFGRGFLDLAFELNRGGTLVPVSRSATTIRIPSRLEPNGPATPPWGRVAAVVYDHPVRRVDLRVDQQQRSGWTRLPTLAATSYHGAPG